MSEIGTVETTIGSKDHLFSLWKSINVVVENDIPATEAEKGFLMEVMTDVSAADYKEGIYSVILPEDKAVACWNCLNVATLNKMYNNRGQETVALETLSNFAESLDEYLQKKNSPQVVEPQSPQSNVLPLVKSSKEKAHHSQSPDKG